MMRQLLDTVWQRRGTSWVWDEEARNQICVPCGVWSLRQFLRAAALYNFPEELPSNNDKTLVVAGLDGSLDLLTPTDAEAWLADAIKPAVLSFQDEYQGDAALVFWLPGCRSRLDVQASSGEVRWLCHAPRGQKIDFGRILWANEDSQEILCDGKPAGLCQLWIT